DDEPVVLLVGVLHHLGRYPPVRHAHLAAAGTRAQGPQPVAPAFLELLGPRRGEVGQGAGEDRRPVRFQPAPQHPRGLRDVLIRQSVEGGQRDGEAPRLQIGQAAEPDVEVLTGALCHPGADAGQVRGTAVEVLVTAVYTCVVTLAAYPV